jgi:hypothetical protein
MIQAYQQTEVNHALAISGREHDFMPQVFRWSWIGFAVATAYQCLFHLEMATLIAIFCVAPAWVVVSNIFLRGSIMFNFPISSFLILAFTSTQLYLPLLFTSLEGKSVVYNLELPEQVFLHSLAAVLVLTVAHAFYRFLVQISYKRPFPLMTRLGFFTPPTDLQLWLMGFVGIAATYYVFFMVPEVGAGVTTGSALDKLVQGLLPFTYAPFFILVGKLYGRGSKPNALLIPFLVVFTIALFAVSIGRNSRGGFMFGFTSLAFAYGIGMLLGIYKRRLLTFKNAILVGVLFWLLTGPMADLGTAMVIVRGDREEIPAAELIDLTLEAYSDKNAIRQRRLEDLSSGWELDWDERFLDNVFTTRFANIKFNDMSLVMASKLDEYDPDMLSHSVDYFLGALPEPFLKAFNFDVDKEQLYSMSVGDYFYMVTGGQGYIESFRTGHFAGTGMATFGWWYLLILGIGMVPIFFLFELFVKRHASPEGTGTQELQFSCCGLLALTTIWGFLPNESVASIGIYMVRGWLQLALLYLLMFHSTWLVSSVFRLNIRWGAEA